MTVKVAINGFGRIGRLVLRAIIESKRNDISVVAINDLGSVAANAHLLSYDSVHGKLNSKVEVTSSGISTEHGEIKVFSERNPENLPWGDLDVDIALECTGLFTKKEDANKHVLAGAKKVLISAPGNGVDYTVVHGVNEKGITDEHKIVSNASCTTNCLAPVAKVLNETVGIESGFMTTVHAFTGDQPVLDTLHSDLRRARAASTSMIPTSTGAAKAVGLVLPELAGKLDGTAVRVPTVNVSMVDLTFYTERATSIEEINNAIKQASLSSLSGVLTYNSEPLVSIDFNHNPASSNFDATQTQVVKEKLVRVLSWYDNEWGFSNRMADVAVLMGK
ncbi:MAG: type I glyceraldehyde-3-phosphate dehydrogenase [Pelagibacterales bacterium]|nr:type I glyceraldehyde-3-phosphate dehydrogenase [Pelagibacterales bacterium]PPR16950.1 MAG: Glyceraldehyde-3-phosphate dehydrogenase [Alphaproteobacteria bacterium MarineAlpha9_Bin3]|tara:strand:+ start:14864 stop:15865 length:1002 start_codon:yes stop_codon:yes gene_type:complete